MAENNLFKDGNGAEHLLAPKTWADLKDLYGHKLKWDRTENLKFGYDPVPVFVHSLVNNVLTFSLVNCKKYEDNPPTETFTIALDDRNQCHRLVPSTSTTFLELGGDAKAQRRVVFLMINADYARTLSSSAGRTYTQVATAMNTPITQIGDIGKWPQTAVAEREERAVAAEARAAAAEAKAQAATLDLVALTAKYADLETEYADVIAKRDQFHYVLDKARGFADAAKPIMPTDFAAFREAAGLTTAGPL